MNTENKEEPTNGDIMTKLISIEKEIEESEKRIKRNISSTVIGVIIGFMLGILTVFYVC